MRTSRRRRAARRPPPGLRGVEAPLLGLEFDIAGGVAGDQDPSAFHFALIEPDIGSASSIRATARRATHEARPTELHDEVTLRTTTSRTGSSRSAPIAPRQSQPRHRDSPSRPSAITESGRCPVIPGHRWPAACWPAPAPSAALPAGLAGLPDHGQVAITPPRRTGASPS